MQAIALSVLVSALVGAVLALGNWPVEELPALAVLRHTLTVVGGALFFGAGLLHLSIWRVDRDASRAYAGAALVVFGLLNTLAVGLGYVLHSSAAMAVLNPITTTSVALVTIVVVLLATRTAPAGRPRPGLIVLLAVGGTFGFLAVVVLAQRQLDLPLDPSPAWHLVLELTVALAWFGAAVTVARRRRGGCAVDGLGVPLLVAMTAIWLLRAAAVMDVAAWGVAVSVLVAATAVVVLSGAFTEFAGAAEAGRERAVTAEEALENVAEAFVELDRQRQNLTHDARNAICALRVASQTLADHGDQLDAEVRHRLRKAMVEELGHLDHLITRPAHADRVGFEVDHVIATVVELERLGGLDVHLDLEPCRASGKPQDFARVVRNLLVNCREHAPGSTVTVRVRDTGADVRVVVEDDGPGIAPEMQSAVFGRGVSGAHSSGSGLGLHVARALMRQQGGSLELSDQHHAGARFVLILTHAEVPPSESAFPEQRAGTPELDVRRPLREAISA